jgi:hypothetical protein
MFTLTIYFIALNVYVEFVLVYRLHPILVSFPARKRFKIRRQKGIYYHGPRPIPIVCHDPHPSSHHTLPFIVTVKK